jgi:OHCU decarboxylase
MKFKHLPSQMDRAEFVEVFGGVYEHSSWVAETAWENGISVEHDNVDKLVELMARIVERSDDDAKLALIKSHPDLAGKAAVKGELTAASTSEQSGAGLSECSEEEFEKFKVYNDAYKEKFGFPFIKAVKNSNRHEIFEGFERRLRNTVDQEFQTALDEIDKIACFRLMEL